MIRLADGGLCTYILHIKVINIALALWLNKRYFK